LAVSIRDRIKHDALAPLPLPLKRKFRLAITQLFTLRSADLYLVTHADKVFGLMPYSGANTVCDFPD
jgi:hypothetical protein